MGVIILARWLIVKEKVLDEGSGLLLAFGGHSKPLACGKTSLQWCQDTVGRARVAAGLGGQGKVRSGQRQCMIQAQQESFSGDREFG